ncbi:MAG: VOC family protein [Acidobacteriaceae bacterium]|nr:VOC family protein [Acidobacteriaceae bacterium]
MRGLRIPPSNPSASTADFLRLHHIGYVVNNIETTMIGFARSLNGVWDQEIFSDPIQKVRVAFLSPPGSEAQIELVQPEWETSPVRAFLERGGGLHHLCYEVEDCKNSLSAMHERGGTILRNPKPAVAFGGRRIAWALTAEKLLLEFLEIRLR